MTLFFGITIGVGFFILPRLQKLLKISITQEFEFSLLLVVALGFGVIAEALQMHFILGAFMAGLFFTKPALDPQMFEGVKNRVSGITTGFLAPIFFASIGMRLDLSAIETIPSFSFPSGGRRRPRQTVGIRAAGVLDEPQLEKSADCRRWNERSRRCRANCC